MDSSDRNKVEQPAGMVTPSESIAIARQGVDRYKLVRRLRRSRTTNTAPAVPTQRQAAGAVARPEPGSWKTLGPIVLDAPSDLAPHGEAEKPGNPLAVATAIAVAVAALTAIAITAFLANAREASPPPHTSTVVPPDPKRSGATVRIYRGGNALTADARV
jgi:hypothetical protein